MRKRLFSFLRTLYPVEVYLFLTFLFLLLWALIAYDLQRLHHRSAENAKTQLYNLARVYAEEVTSSIHAADYVL
ncbi:hypothetical protein Q8A64_16400, partial [Oxalobacteraceae bacterium R-40]|nr:hypothetical protein [Oxalobacteraceae bacterium R-40]